MRAPILSLPACLLAASPAFAHENAAEHGAMAQDSLLSALVHRLFGAHHAGETIVLLLGIVGIAAVAVLARRRS